MIETETNQNDVHAFEARGEFAKKGNLRFHFEYWIAKLEQFHKHDL